ncbi:MAG: glycosyltransferase family 2 protein [Rhodanobacteraceae bacterium]
MALSTSIVLCTFNGARFLETQWDSLLGQSRLPDEIIVRDDASTDATPELLASLAAEAEACGIVVRCIRGERNLGYVANFETALRAASGDVLFLCDQDDLWHPGKLATQVEWFERRAGLLLLCGDARRIDADGAALQRTLFDVLRVTRGELRRIHSGDGFGVLLRRSLATGATIALRRDLLADALPIPKGWVHDEWLAIIAAARGGFDCIEEPLIDYRQHAKNQLGMHDRALAAKWRDLVKPRPAMIDRLIARDETLHERLQALGARVSQSSPHRTAEKLCHLRARGSLQGGIWRRAATVLRETASGRYGRYAAGWRDAMRDLLRRVET